MFGKKTKWLPLGSYNFDGTDRVVFFRGNLKTGMMEFKVKKVHTWTFLTHQILPGGLIDTTSQWNGMAAMLGTVFAATTPLVKEPAEW